MTTLGVAPNLLNSVGPWRRLPLLSSDQAALSFRGPGLFMTYVPSRYGGELEVGCDRDGAQVLVRHPKPDSAALKDLAGNPIPAGKTFTYETAPGEFGWFYIYVAPIVGDYKMWATFREIGLAREAKDQDAEPLIPWNFWYFPYALSRQADSAYGSAVMQPCQKYETAFGKAGVLQWEKANHDDPQGTRAGWEGHCHNAAPASMVFATPPAGGKTVNAVDFLCEELKFFATEFIGRHGALDYRWGLPGHGPQGRSGYEQEHKPSDDPARFGRVVGDFHNALRKCLLEDMTPLLVDLRDSQGGEHGQVWNQAVYLYEALLYETPGSHDWRDVQVYMFLLANQDFLSSHGQVSSGLPATVVADGPRPGGKPKTARANDTGRDQILQYRLIFREDGTIAVKDKRNEWYSVTLDQGGAQLHAPRFMFAPKKPTAQASPGGDGNPKLERSEVLQLVQLRARYA